MLPEGLEVVLRALTDGARDVLDDTLVDVHLTGSFALGAGDEHADVDFVAVLRSPLTATQEQGLRDLHRALPDRPEPWARVLEGCYAPLAELRERAGGHRWLYVDNGHREMEWSDHDDTEVCRWVLAHCTGADLDPPPERAMRDEAAALAVSRGADALADPAYLENAWGQPHEVLIQCRLLHTATTGAVTSKAGAAAWCRGVLPLRWHGLLDTAVASRPDPWGRVHRTADPGLTALTRDFIAEHTARVVAAAAATADVLSPGSGSAGTVDR